jgi:hypothetical protein
MGQEAGRGPTPSRMRDVPAHLPGLGPSASLSVLTCLTAPSSNRPTRSWAPAGGSEGRPPLTGATPRRRTATPTGYTHRLGWRLLRGPIPEGKELHHRCGVFACWNPDHLEPATHAENQSHMRKTHCKPGALALTGSETCSSRTSKERSITLGEYPRASAMTAADASLVSSYSLPSRAAS